MARDETALLRIVEHIHAAVVEPAEEEKMTFSPQKESISEETAQGPRFLFVCCNWIGIVSPRNLPKIMTLVVLCAMSSGVAEKSAIAQAAPCERLLAHLFDLTPSGAPWHADMLAFRTTARGADGFVSFSMNLGYNIEHHYFNTSHGRIFAPTELEPSRDRIMLSGRFQEVFPGRADGKTDVVTLEVIRTGRAFLVLHTWGNARGELSNLTCYRGASGQVVVTGSFTSASHGTDFWTFLLTRYDPAGRLF